MMLYNVMMIKCCINCTYWDEVFRRGILKYRCINESSEYYMHDTDAEQCCEEFEKNIRRAGAD